MIWIGKNWVACDDGSTALEYALIAVLVSVGIIGGLTVIGVDLVRIFTGIDTGIQDAISAASGT